MHPFKIRSQIISALKVDFCSTTQKDPDPIFTIFLKNQKLLTPLPYTIYPISPDNYSTNYDLSPDGKWLAYLEKSFDNTNNKETKRYLRLMDSDGRKYDLPFWSLDWQWLIGWVNNQQIALMDPRNLEGTITILDPFSKETKELLPTFPHIQSTSSKYHNRPENFYYNSSLSHVVYLEEADDWDTVIYDVNLKKIVWNGDKDMFGKLEWSPDGTKIVFEKYTAVNNKALVRITKDGDETILWKITDIYTNIQFSLSPNSKYLAAWLDYSSDKRSLSIINMETNEIIDYCIDGHIAYQFSPFWSPDNKYVAFPVFDDQKKMLSTVILDKQLGQAYKISDNDIVFGWMATP